MYLLERADEEQGNKAKGNCSLQRCEEDAGGVMEGRQEKRGKEV